MKKKVIVISNFHEDATMSRTNMAFKYFSDRGFDTIALYSSFSHSLKKFRYFEEERFIALKTIAYHSTLSFNRILSHLIFTYKAFIYLRKAKVDVVYLNLPPNLLALAALLNPGKEIKVIVDIIDLWPESFPHNNSIIRKTLLFFIGIIPKQIRRISIKKSNYCLTESNFFFKKLQLKNKKSSKIIYLKKFQTDEPDTDQISDIFSIVYLGNIGNIYDFESLFKIIKGIEKYREVHLHIIGLGPNSDRLFNNLKLLRINYTYHGASFDEKLKKKVLIPCWFGFNGYKPSAEVALSYKSIDYLSYGVPLLNSAKEDTFHLIKSEKVGFNFNENNLGKIIEILSTISVKDVIEMKKKSYLTFMNKFSGQSYYQEMDEVMNNM